MTSTHRLFLDHLETPIGRLAIVVDEGGRLHASFVATKTPSRARRTLKA